MEHTFKVWARVGMTVHVTESDAQAIKAAPEAFFRSAFLNGKAEVDGDIYFPSEAEENNVYATATGLELD